VAASLFILRCSASRRVDSGATGSSSAACRLPSLIRAAVLDVPPRERGESLSDMDPSSQALPSPRVRFGIPRCDVYPGGASCGRRTVTRPNSSLRYSARARPFTATRRRSPWKNAAPRIHEMEVTSAFRIDLTHRRALHRSRRDGAKGDESHTWPRTTFSAAICLSSGPKSTGRPTVPFQLACEAGRPRLPVTRCR
jgi:hypothetical protein